MCEREIVEEKAEKHLVDGWLWKRKEGKLSSFSKAGEFSFVCISFEVLVDGLREVAGRCPYTEGFSASFTPG